jgi:predicted DNA-binding transcriptional regulator AlpA
MEDLQMKPATTLPETGYIRLPTVLSVLPMAKSTFYLGIKNNKYPKPTKLSERISAWRVEDIRRLLEDLAA